MSSEEARSSAAAAAEPEEDPERWTWKHFLEGLLPARTFAKSDTPDEDLKYGRFLVFLFYCVFGAVFLYQVVRFVWSGRIELFEGRYKVDVLEAPSLAICPFDVNATVVRPPSLVDDELVKVRKVSHHGSTWLKVDVKSCQFDRQCMCVDMQHYRLKDISADSTKDPSDPSSFVDDHMLHKERIELFTRLEDPSSAKVLKVGLYNSADLAPEWLYVNQGQLLIGQLELIIWTVVDVSIPSMLRTLEGAWRAMARNRYLYRCTSQQVNMESDGRSAPGTEITYEMKTFFVEETMSSYRALSVYSLVLLAILIAMRHVIIDTFVSFMFPIYTEKHEGPEPRELSEVAKALRSNLFCCFFQAEEPRESSRKSTARGEAEGETRPLLPKAPQGP